MKKRIRIVVAYDGTNYCGWQIQQNGVTIEEMLNKALSELLREPITVIGASRTDSGVHAEGNVAVFDTENRMPADKICFALNQRLPADIRVLGSEEVTGNWHPRKQNCIKTYEYKILNRRIDMPTLRLYTHFCYVSLDVEAMKKAAEYLVGEHDFKSFCTMRTQVEETVRTIYSLTVEQAGDIITIRISGSGFLYNMVRIIAGTLMRVGVGAYAPGHMETILDGRDRQKAGPKAPARGLTLISLDYETELRPEISGENKNWYYRLIQREIGPKGKAYLAIHRCMDMDFERLLMRVTHQAVRNGAREVYVCDKERNDRIQQDQNYGFYRFKAAHEMWKMSCSVGQIQDRAVQQSATVDLERVGENNLMEFCRLYNEVFYAVPNSSTMTEDELSERLEHDQELIFFVKQEEKIVGFVMLIYKETNLEIDSIGIKAEFRKRGLAEAVLIKADTLAEELRAGSLCLLVSDSNEVAYHIYEKLGFRKEERVSVWYQTQA